MNHLLDATMAEALALLKGLEFLEQLGIQSAINESDCLKLIQACNAEVEVWNPSAEIFAECFMKAQAFDLIEANKIAHELARSSFSTNSVLRWTDVPPNFIIPFVLNNVTLLDS